LIRWIANLAYMQRIRGRHPVAAELFDVAMQLAEQVGDKAGLALVYRNACYLLSDWGCFDEAGDFAERAIALATAVKDLPGIGLSHYVYGVISTYKGRNELATSMFETSLLYLEDWQVDARVNAWQSLAFLQLEEKNVELAAESLSELEDVSDDQLALPTRARVALTRGELNSQSGNYFEAEKYFDLAENLFAQCEDLSDLILVGLYRAQSFARQGRRDLIKAKAVDLLALGNDRRLVSGARAILQELARHCYQDGLPTQHLRASIAQWRRLGALATAR
jgi:tetratricopeptide (TPR) repeat protein